MKFLKFPPKAPKPIYALGLLCALSLAQANHVDNINQTVIDNHRYRPAQHFSSVRTAQQNLNVVSQAHYYRTAEQLLSLYHKEAIQESADIAMEMLRRAEASPKPGHLQKGLYHVNVFLEDSIDSALDAGNTAKAQALFLHQVKLNRYELDEGRDFNFRVRAGKLKSSLMQLRDYPELLTPEAELELRGIRDILRPELFRSHDLDRDSALRLLRDGFENREQRHYETSVPFEFFSALTYDSGVGLLQRNEKAKLLRKMADENQALQDGSLRDQSYWAENLRECDFCEYAIDQLLNRKPLPPNAPCTVDVDEFFDF